MTVQNGQNGQNGQLIGIGVGTGDADLITLKAYKLLQSASVDCTVLAYMQPAGKPSMARRSVAPHVPVGGDMGEIVLTMPMQTDTATAAAVYNRGAEQILAVIGTGKTVLFLCEGDPMFYGSFMYIYDRLHRQVPTQIVAGITAVSAACSVAHIAFASRDDVCTIVPATLDMGVLAQHLQSADSIAIVKIGRHLHKVKTALKTTNRLDKAVCVAYATLPHQCILPLMEVRQAPYFSIIISTRHQLY